MWRKAARVLQDGFREAFGRTHIPYHAFMAGLGKHLTNNVALGNARYKTNANHILSSPS